MHFDVDNKLCVLKATEKKVIFLAKLLHCIALSWKVKVAGKLNTLPIKNLGSVRFF